MKRGKTESKNKEDDNGFAAWGGYMAAKKSKLLEQFTDSASNITNKQSNLFNGVSIFVNGYTNPTADELKHIMALHGGIYHHYHSSAKTTYIIASNLPDSKIKQMGPNQKIIKPEWITECLKAGKLLDYSKYLLYTNCNRKQPRLNFEKIVKEDTETIVINDDEDECQLSPDIFGSYENDDTDNNLACENDKQNNSCSVDKDFKLPENKKEKVVEKPGRTLTANDPKFLTEFYNNSRLHHIATLGATFKQYVCNLREQSNFKFPLRQELKIYVEDMKRVMPVDNISASINHKVIMHIDMDCFFVSVGLRKRPELIGLPVAVTHSKGGQEPSLRSGVDRQAELECYQQRAQEKLKLKNVELGPGNMLKRLEGIENQSMSEIASCSYEARKAGVKNGMFMGTALKLCPNIQTIPYDFDGYKEVAYTLYNTISEYTLNIEAVSCDEMFVDITDLLKETGATVNQWATYIRGLIQTRTGCPCSTGFGQNRLQARVATKTAKPNGQFHLIPTAVEEYMRNIKVDDLPGVGSSTSLKLQTFGVKSCGDLQSMTIGELRSIFGNKTGESLFNHSRGIDDRQLVYEHERKSVSAEVNYGIRFKNNAEAETFLKQLVSEVHSRLTEIKMKGKCITLKLMVRSKDAPEESSKFMGHGICDYITKSSSLSVSTNELRIIEREILSIAQKSAVPPADLRGIGIQISKLEKEKNTGLFGGITKYLNTTKTSSENAKNENNLNNANLNLNVDKESVPSKSTNAFTISSNKNTTKASTENVKNENNQNNININLNVDKETLPLKNVNTFTILPNKNWEINSSNKTKISTENIQNENNQNTFSNKTRDTAKISPVKNNQTNTVRRGRGRGRGGKTIERKSSNNGDLTKFLSTPHASTSKVVKEQVPLELVGIDMEVFTALPEYIQQEILAQYEQVPNKTEDIMVPESPTKHNNNNQDKKIHDTVAEENETNIITIPETIETEVTACTSKTDKDGNCVFRDMDMKQIKKLIEDWVVSRIYPEDCDIKMLGDYFKELALDKKIDNLFLLLKFLFSEIKLKNNCEWHKAYFQIEMMAQEGMLARYGTKISTPKKFKCENRCHV